MPNDEEITTMKVRRRTRDRLAAVGRKDDTFDDVVSRLLDFWDRYEGAVKRAR